MPGLCHGTDSLQCGKGVVCEIAPGIGSDSHPLAPLGVLAPTMLHLPSDRYNVVAIATHITPTEYTVFSY